MAARTLSLPTPKARLPPPGRALFGSQRSQLFQVMAASADPKSGASEPAQSKELKLMGPEPKRFTVAEGQLSTVATAAFPFLMRAGSGGFVAGYRSGLKAVQDGKYAVVNAGGRALEESSDLIASFPRPAKPLELYEFEGCPFCRKVREAVCILDLDVVFYPCPKDGPTWRPKAVGMGGKKMFPFLVDPNTGKSMYESDDIINYLFNTYGDGKVPLALRLGFLTTLTCGLALAPRGGRGSWYKGAKAPPAQLLVYWGYEASPFCKIVREKLSELEVPHLQRSCARGSPKRQELLDQRGHFQVPYIEDPNTGVAMFESAAIIKYLEETYGQPAAAS